MTYSEKILDELDAAIFSGDSFHNTSDFENLKYHLERWTRALTNIKDIINESESQDE